jgi:hypothetical protein
MGCRKDHNKDYTTCDSTTVYIQRSLPDHPNSNMEYTNRHNNSEHIRVYSIS